jgi:putative heme-binding domain-containing protein
LPDVAGTSNVSGLPLDGYAPLVARIRRAATALFPKRNATLDFETARLLAFVEVNDPALPNKVVSFFTERSAASDDFHFLAVLARLESPLPTNATLKLGAAIASLDRKLDGLEFRPKQNWTVRLNEVVQVLLQRNPKLGDAIIRQPNFARPGNLALVPLLGSDQYVSCARMFFAVAQHDPNFPWSGPLVDLLAALPNDEALPLLRRQWANVALRDRLTLELARKPQLEDRDKFVTALSSTQPQVVRAAMSALLKLPPDTSIKAIVATLKALRRAANDPKEQALRAQAVTWLNQMSGQAFNISEQGGNTAQAYQPVFNWFDAKHPGVMRQLDADDDENPSAWERFYKTVPWTKGIAARGEELFRNRACQTCHGSSQSIAPDLGGVANRLSPADLFNAIIFPSRDVSPAYRMMAFQMRDGSSHTGLVAFESADGVIVRTGLDSTVRLAEADIRSRHPSDISFMPNGMLRGLGPQDFADLYAYMKTLQPVR